MKRSVIYYATYFCIGQFFICLQLAAFFLHIAVSHFALPEFIHIAFLSLHIAMQSAEDIVLLSVLFPIMLHLAESILHEPLLILQHCIFDSSLFDEFAV